MFYRVLTRAWVMALIGCSPPSSAGPEDSAKTEHHQGRDGLGSAGIEGEPPQESLMDHSKFPSKPTCATVIDALVTMDFRDWRGLPEDCAVDALLAAFPGSPEAVGRGRIGNPGRTMSYRRLRYPKQPVPPRLWFDDNRVVLIDIEHPKLPHAPDVLLDALGVPSGRLDFAFDILQVTGGERVYSDRGITVFYKENTDLIVRISLYAPTIAVSGYKTRYRLNLARREQP